jgi:threonine dehydratase
MRMLLDHAGLIVEPSAALGITAILEDRDRFASRHVVTIVCGGNVDIDAYHRWVVAAPSTSLDNRSTLAARIRGPYVHRPGHKRLTGDVSTVTVIPSWRL